MYRATTAVNARSTSPEPGPKRLLPRSKPTPEKPPSTGPLKEIESPDPQRDMIWRKLRGAAKNYQLYAHKYEKLSENQLRILFVKPSRDPDAELVARLETLTYDELKQKTEYEALSYHVSGSLK
jgi:hypothetical protein